MDNPAPGVLRRRKSDGEVFERKMPIMERHPKNHGQYVVDAVVDANDVSNQQKNLVNHSRSR